MLRNTHALFGFLSRDRGRFLAYTALGAGAICLSLLAGWQHGRPTAAPAAPGLAEATNPFSPMAARLGPWARSAARAASEAAPQQSAALAPSAAPAQATVQATVDARVEAAPATEATAPVTTAEAPAEASTLADAPLPPRRPADLKAAHTAEPARMRQAAVAPAPAPAAPAQDERGFFEKFFGGGETREQPAQQQAPAGRSGRRAAQAAPAQPQALAYAPQESTGGLFGALSGATTPPAPATGPAPRAGAGTAVYDISAHTVYMPDGTRLEAHSGLGPHLDDPRFVHVRMKGPTPPSVYALSPREALFHGVEALRLTSIGGGNLFGRAGLLAHTYMLGPNGDSNGCVSFRDYDAFLQAYKRGAVRRLVVVARM